MNRPPEPAPPSEPRQRWRITFARDPVAADAVGRALLDAWQEAESRAFFEVQEERRTEMGIRPIPLVGRGVEQN